MNILKTVRDLHIIAGLALLTSACDPIEASPALKCGSGEALETVAQRLCVYRQSIIETGIKCPVELSHSFPYGSLDLCSDQPSLQPESRPPLHERFEQEPQVNLPALDAPLCAAVEACAPSSPCRRGVCTADASCSADRDCASGESCRDNLCLAPRPTCMSDAQCPQDQECINNFCTTLAPSTPCETSADCPEGDICSDKSCIPDELGCAADTDCAQEESYVNQRCQGEPLPLCSMDQDCGEGERCFDGLCSLFTGCLSDSECEEGQRCIRAKCTP